MICLHILHYALPQSILHCKVCYIVPFQGDSSTAPKLYMCFCWYIWYVCASYNGVCIDIFVHLITVSVLLCLCMLYNLIFGYTYISCEWIIPPLRHFYICVLIHIFVNFISMINVICLCTSYYPLLGWATYWESFHEYSLYIICYSVVVILIDLHSQKCLNISLFELVVTGIETHIFVPNLSISHVFISIIKFSIVSYF